MKLSSYYFIIITAAHSILLAAPQGSTLLHEQYTAATAPVEETIIERWSKASPGQSWVLEVKNKTNKPVYMQMYKISPRSKNNTRQILRAIPVSDAYNPYGSQKNNKTAAWRTTPNPNTRIQAAKSKEEADAGYLRIAPIDKYTIEFNPGSTDWFLYLWNEDKAKEDPMGVNKSIRPAYIFWLRPDYSRKIIALTLETIKEKADKVVNVLRPQSGSGVFSKKTQSGLSLSGNIKDTDIIPVYNDIVEYLNFETMSVTDNQLNEIREALAPKKK